MNSRQKRRNAHIRKMAMNRALKALFRKSPLQRKLAEFYTPERILMFVGDEPWDGYIVSQGDLEALKSREPLSGGTSLPENFIYQEPKS